MKFSTSQNSSSHIGQEDKFKKEAVIDTKMPLPAFGDVFPFAITLLALFVPGLTNIVIFSSESLFQSLEYVKMLLLALVYTMPFFIFSAISYGAGQWFEELVKYMIKLKDIEIATAHSFVCIGTYYSCLILTYLIHILFKIDFSLFNLYFILGVVVGTIPLLGFLAEVRVACGRVFDIFNTI